ncbi:MAG: CvpA family protein [Lactobacillaceae bacterium]|jgi:membrane protein required for colicin V production|nr:CvpA family protein [Lactobacillaceae bacterium]
MQLLNNLDIVILVVVAISSFLAFNRGITKELFSILGWTLIIAATVFLLPILNKFVSQYVENVALVSVIGMCFILLALFIFWNIFTKKLVGKIRDSKLSYFDRIFGFGFGFVRGGLLVVLFYILVNWITPREYQTETIKDSVYFEMAGVLAKPLEKMIPEETLRNIHEKSSIERFINEMDDDTSASLFELLSQPQIKKLKEEKVKLEEEKAELENRQAEEY